KEAAELAFADAEPLGEGVDACAVAIERTVGNERKTAQDSVRSAAPGAELRCRLRPATQAGAKACFLRRSGRRIEAAVLEFRRSRRADRPTIDPGRGHADEDAAVEARIPCLERSIAG